MTLEYYRLLFDFGLVVLIWLVQLVVYPGFKYYQREQLLKWHPLYTVQITFVVLPLMFGQLILSVIQLWERLDWYTGISFIVIVLLWGLTFLQFVSQTLICLPESPVCSFKSLRSSGEGYGYSLFLSNQFNKTIFAKIFSAF